MNRMEGKDLASTLAAYASQKGCAIEDIVYNIIEEKKGFLGIGNKVVIDCYCEKDVEEFIVMYLKKFFADLDVEVEVEITCGTDGYSVMLNAENNAIIIGKAGQTLQALNVVTRAAVANTFKKRVRLLIDINGYKEERYEKVRAMARRIAKTVQRTKVSALLDPMPNDERKVVHQYLTTMKNIKTESEGEGRNRRLRISYVENED